MPTAIFESPIPATPSELFSWHAREGAFARLRPPWQSLRVDRPAPVENGSRARLRLKKGPLWLGWTAEHRDVEPGRGFTDVQIAGPFARWVHRHEFEPDGDGALLRDRIDYELPAGALGRAVAGRQIEADLRATFAYRHETTRRDLLRHGALASRPRLRVAVSGASGLIGGSLVPFLTTGGHDVVPLTRSPSAAPDAAVWHPETGLEAPDRLGRLDAVVHLAGENIAAGRWTAARKERIRDSRVEGTRNLVRSLGRMAEPPRTLVCASAIGFYGRRGSETVDESSESGQEFLAATSRAWEKAAETALELGMRVVLLRFGIVLTPEGGALGAMLPAFRCGLGGRLGSGRQAVSWISIDDAIGAIYRALMDTSLAGPVNVVSPRPATNVELTETLGRVLRRPTVMALPAFGARLLFGEMADEMLLAGARVLPRRLLESGFEFFDADLERTLRHLLGRRERS